MQKSASMYFTCAAKIQQCNPHVSDGTALGIGIWSEMWLFLQNRENVNLSDKEESIWALKDSRIWKTFGKNVGLCENCGFFHKCSQKLDRQI